MNNGSIVTRLKESVTVKILFIIFIILLLMIPNAMIQGLVSERSFRKNNIEQEVAKSYGQNQTVMIPFVKVPYKVKIENNNDVSWKEEALFIAPVESRINTGIETSQRRRSIYDIVVYSANIKIQQTFDLSRINFESYIEENLDFNQACLIFGLSDPNGIKNNISVTINNDKYPIASSAAIKVNNRRWLESEKFSLDKEALLHVSLNFGVKGTRGLMIEPLGEVVETDFSSPWEAPSFVGKQLPDTYDISEVGFVSRWLLNKFSHSYPLQWSDENVFAVDNAFGVNLILPVDEYGKNKRTAKYAILIIGLTFGIFFFFEIMFRRNIHPVQYILIGFALTVFYLLLLSITEHLGFNVSYMISSIATVGLITMYTKYILASNRGAMYIAFLLFLLFGYIFIILQLEDFALLSGAISLFVILAVVMYLSRNVDWYNLAKHRKFDGQ